MCEGANEPKARRLFEETSDEGKARIMSDFRARGLLPPMPLESDEAAIQRRIAKYVNERPGRLFTKLPVLALRRAGAQSTTGTRDVANDWGGVGSNPPDPIRVVLRIEAPSTSVLSLPVYGQNDQQEHETVVIGTKDKWLWDAWRDHAPDFDDQTISGEHVPKKPLVQWPKPIDYDTKMALKGETTLVVDLQAEDRDKPHWMTGVNWAVQSIAKFDEAKHPRQPKGSAQGGEFAQTRQGARAALQDAVGREIPVGVDDHPTAIQAAHQTAAVLREMRAKGYEMPEEIEIRLQSRKYPSGAVEERGLLTINVPDNLPPEMTLDEAYAIAYGPNVKVAVIEDWEAREIRKYTGDTFRDLIIHEMGHINRRGSPRTLYLTARSSPEERVEAEASTKAFGEEMAAIKQFERVARRSVSQYATTNPDEFVAEVFTLLYNGKTLPEETMKTYEALRGAKIR